MAKEKKVICTLDVIGKVNVGFTIIGARDTVGDFPAYVVLGFKKTDGRYGPAVEYVTWIYNADLDGFDYGNYYLDFQTAVRDFNSRNRSI